MDDFYSDAWNNLGTANEPSYSSPTDSSGFSLSGLPVGGILSILGSGLNSYGTLIAGKEEKQAYDYNAQLSLDEGKFQVEQLENEEEHYLSTQKAMYAKAGVTQAGSALDTAVNTATNFEMDKQVTNYNAQSKANMLTYEGNVVRSQSRIKAGETLLSGALSGLAGLL